MNIDEGLKRLGLILSILIPIIFLIANGGDLMRHGGGAYWAGAFFLGGGVFLLFMGIRWIIRGFKK